MFPTAASGRYSTKNACNCVLKFKTKLHFYAKLVNNQLTLGTSIFSTAPQISRYFGYLKHETLVATRI